MRLLIPLLLLVSGCFSAQAAVAPAPDPRPVPAPVPVTTVGLAWVIAEAPIDLKLVGAVLAVQVLEASGERRIIKVGTWWREQEAPIEPVRPSSAPGVLFRTKAAIGHDVEPITDPEFQIVRAASGELAVEGRSGAGPWRELARVPLPAVTKLELFEGQ